MMSAPTISCTTSVPRPSLRARAVEDRRERLRLRLKPKAVAAGWVDVGGGRDRGTLPRSCPACCRCRWFGWVASSGSVTTSANGPTPLHKISCGGGVVRFERYRSQHANTVDVLAAAPRVTLLVVAPEASAHTAHVALLTAGHRHTDDVDTLVPVAPDCGRGCR